MEHTIRRLRRAIAKAQADARAGFLDPECAQVRIAAFERTLGVLVGKSEDERG